MQPEELELTFLLPNGGRLKFSTEAICLLLSFKQSSPTSTEAGGIIIGRYITDCNDIVIDTLTTPNKGDIRKRFQFFRRSGSHQKVLDLQWSLSNGKFNYLGEWHTHPESFPSPSAVDLQGWQKKMKDVKIPGYHIYFIIIGISEVAVWEGNKKDGKIIKLEKDENRKEKKD